MPCKCKQYIVYTCIALVVVTPSSLPQTIATVQLCTTHRFMKICKFNVGLFDGPLKTLQDGQNRVILQEIKLQICTFCTCWMLEKVCLECTIQEYRVVTDRPKQQFKHMYTWHCNVSCQQNLMLQSQCNSTQRLSSSPAGSCLTLSRSHRPQ